MKTTLKILAACITMISFCGGARSQSGIYLNAADFKNNQVTYGDEGSTKRNKIHIHDFFWNMPGIKVIHDGKKHNLKKNELYGYRSDKSEIYRFYNNTEYRIAETGDICIYVQEKNIAQSKGFRVVNAYYFSATADGEIVPLTLDNLKNEYKGNEKFVSLLEQSFINDNVNAYDKEHKTFKVNYIYQKAVK
jgi:hypothetical protein